MFTPRHDFPDQLVFQTQDLCIQLPPGHLSNVKECLKPNVYKRECFLLPSACSIWGKEDLFQSSRPPTRDRPLVCPFASLPVDSVDSTFKFHAESAYGPTQSPPPWYQHPCLFLWNGSSPKLASCLHSSLPSYLSHSALVICLRI